MTNKAAISYLEPMAENAKYESYREALDMAIAALREQEERENQKPLTPDELRKIIDDPVWIQLIDENEGFWVLRSCWIDARNPEPLILFHMNWYSHSDYGKTWIAYRSKPKEGTE